MIDNICTLFMASRSKINFLEIYRGTGEMAQHLRAASAESQGPEFGS